MDAATLNRVVEETSWLRRSTHGVHFERSVRRDSCRSGRSRLDGAWVATWSVRSRFFSGKAPPAGRRGGSASQRSGYTFGCAWLRERGASKQDR